MAPCGEQFSPWPAVMELVEVATDSIKGKGPRRAIRRTLQLRTIRRGRGRRTPRLHLGSRASSGTKRAREASGRTSQALPQRHPLQHRIRLPHRPPNRQCIPIRRPPRLRKGQLCLRRRIQQHINQQWAAVPAAAPGTPPRGDTTGSAFPPRTPSTGHCPTGDWAPRQYPLRLRLRGVPRTAPVAGGGRTGEGAHIVIVDGVRRRGWTTRWHP